MAEANNTPGFSDAHCQLYSILNTPPSYPGHKVISDLPKLNKSQFCEAFFHVPEVLNCKTIMQCLDEESCRVNKLKEDAKCRKRIQQTYVVSFVVLKIGDNVKYKALFENCVQEEPTKHAEEYFLEDATTGKLKRILEELQNSDVTSKMASLNLKEKHGCKVYMYITLQPCYYSIENDNREKSCTEILIEFYKGYLKSCKPLGIRFIVKPTFIYKAYWLLSKKKAATKKGKELGKQIENAKEGLRKLFEEGIKVQAMEEEDWTVLKNHLCPSIELFPGSTYEESERKKLDDFIREFLEEIGGGSASTPRGSASTPRGSAQRSSGSASTPHGNAQRSSGSASTPRGSAQRSSGSASTPHGSAQRSSGSASTPRGNASRASGSASTPRGNASRASGTVSRSSYDGSGAIPKVRKKKDEDKKKETKHGKLASN